MGIVTASTAMLGIKQDGEILGGIGLGGGFTTPVLVSTGQNHEVELFSYVALLCAASVALVAVKPWRRLLILSYLGMVGLYVGWYSAFYRRPEFAVTLVFATVFFAIFTVAPLVSRVPEGSSLLQPPAALTPITPRVYFLQPYAMFSPSYN